jgi:hypothetical protein
MSEKKCGARCAPAEPRPLTDTEQIEALDAVLEALRAHPDKARELAIILRLAADK